MVHLLIGSHFPQHSAHCYTVLISNIMYVIINQRPCGLQVGSSTSLDCLCLPWLTYVCNYKANSSRALATAHSYLKPCVYHIGSSWVGIAAEVEGGCSVLLLPLILPHKHPCLLKCKMSSVSWTFSLVASVGKWMFLGLTCSSMLICKGIAMRS